MTDAEYLASLLHQHSRDVAGEMECDVEEYLARAWEEVDEKSREIMTRVAAKLLQHDVVLNKRLIESIASASLPGINVKKMDHSKRTNKITKKLSWLISYIIQENFSPEHLDAICHIIGLFNDCEESEIEIFEFADMIYKKYGN